MSSVLKLERKSLMGLARNGQTFVYPSRLHSSWRFRKDLPKTKPGRLRKITIIMKQPRKQVKVSKLNGRSD